MQGRLERAPEQPGPAPLVESVAPEPEHPMTTRTPPGLGVPPGQLG